PLIPIKLGKAEISESPHKISFAQHPVLYPFTDFHLRDVQDYIIGPLDYLVEIPVGVAYPALVTRSREVPHRRGSCIVSARDHVVRSIQKPGYSPSIHVVIIPVLVETVAGGNGIRFGLPKIA